MCHRSQSQAGFLVPLSMFLLVGAASLALAISQLASGSRSSAVMMAINAQTHFAADAGMQSAVSQLYFDESFQAGVDANCTALDGGNLVLSGEGLAGCSVALGCEITYSADSTISVYQIDSVASCGSGGYQASRGVRVNSYMADP